MRVLPLLLMAASVAACGYKGPLYLAQPRDPVEAKPVTPEPAPQRPQPAESAPSPK